jgi:hypothetical protein
MHAVEIQQLLDQTPFEPFVISMANGRQFVVDHPEVAMFSVNKGSLAVAMREGGFAILDLRLATHVEPPKKPSRGRKR